MALCPRVDARLSWLLLAIPVLLGAEPRSVEQALLKEAKTVPGRHAFLFAEYGQGASAALCQRCQGRLRHRLQLQVVHPGALI